MELRDIGESVLSREESFCSYTVKVHVKNSEWQGRPGGGGGRLEQSER